MYSTYFIQSKISHTVLLLLSKIKAVKKQCRCGLFDFHLCAAGCRSSAVREFRVQLHFNAVRLCPVGTKTKLYGFTDVNCTLRLQSSLVYFKLLSYALRPEMSASRHRKLTGMRRRTARQVGQRRGRRRAAELSRGWGPSAGARRLTTAAPTW